MLFRVGDRRYPLIAIIEGEAAILDADRCGDHPPRPVRIPRRDEPALGPDGLPDGGRDRADALHRRRARAAASRSCSTTARSATCCCRPSSPAGRRCRARDGVGVEIVGPHSSEATRQLVDFARRNRLPFDLAGHRPPREHAEARALIDGLADEELPLVRLPGGPELRNPSPGELSRALGIGLDLDQTETVDLLVVGGGPGRARRRRLRRVGRARHARRRGQRSRRPGGDVAQDRELPRLPGRHQRHRADGPGRHARRGSSAPARRRRTGRSRSSPASSTISCGSRAARR